MSSLYNIIDGVMVSMLTSSEVDRGFESRSVHGVMVSMLTSSEVDRGFESRSVHGVMVSMLTSSEVDRGFESRSGQTKDYQICISCFSVP